MSELVFVCDDDRGGRESLARALERAGHEVEAFADGREVLTRLESPPDQLGQARRLRRRETGARCAPAPSRAPGLRGVETRGAVPYATPRSSHPSAAPNAASCVTTTSAPS